MLFVKIPPICLRTYKFRGIKLSKGSVKRNSQKIKYKKSLAWRPVTWSISGLSDSLPLHVATH